MILYSGRRTIHTAPLYPSYANGSLVVTSGATGNWCCQPLCVSRSIHGKTVRLFWRIQAYIHIKTALIDMNPFKCNIPCIFQMAWWRRIQRWRHARHRQRRHSHSMAPLSAYWYHYKCFAMWHHRQDLCFFPISKICKSRWIHGVNTFQRLCNRGRHRNRKPLTLIGCDFLSRLTMIFLK